LNKVITASTLVTEVASTIEEPIETPYIDMMLAPQPEFTGVPNGVPDSFLLSDSYSTIVFSGSSTELSWGTSTGMLESLVGVTSELVPYPTPIPVYAITSGNTTTIGNSSTLSSSPILPTLTGAAAMGMRADGAIAAGLVGLLGFVV
jgi:hypothetical protein